MTMNYKQWKEILGAVNKETDLSKDNVIDKIKEELKKYPEAGFDDQLTLLHLAASCDYAKIVNLLIENDASVDV